MAGRAVARETIFALRRQIAKIEGQPAERLDGPLCKAGKPGEEFFATGSDNFDRALGGGIPGAGLVEILGGETRDAGAASGFALALAAMKRRMNATRAGPVLWIATSDILREAGFPYAPGIERLFGIPPGAFLVAAAEKLKDALWIAEEAARQTALSAVLLEVRGNQPKLDLTATRRLNHRARDVGHPVFLVRQSADAQPTAAALRLLVSSAPAGLRATLGGPLAGSIGPPAFAVTVGKSRGAPSGRHVLEWNPHDFRFDEAQAAHSRRVVSLSRGRAGSAAASGAVVAFDPAA